MTLNTADENLEGGTLVPRPTTVWARSTGLEIDNRSTRGRSKKPSFSSYMCFELGDDDYTTEKAIRRYTCNSSKKQKNSVRNGQKRVK